MSKSKKPVWWKQDIKHKRLNEILKTLIKGDIKPDNLIEPIYQMMYEYIILLENKE